ncbi:MAG: UvrD/REP helicase [Acidimicrobiaceae bacterium]|nr:UvrD/REP helicase [Acidimicrobiaceae bacterium]
MTASQEWQRRLLAGCDEEQLAAITSPAAPLLVVAGAGSGKTRVLTRRIAWRVHEGLATPGHVLALTFTRKAAAELRSRLAGLGLPGPVTAGTFHAVALAQLRRRAADAGRTPPVLLDSKARLLGAIVPERGLRLAGGRSGRPPERRELLSALAGEIEWAKARLVTPAGYLEAARVVRRNPPVAPEEVAETYARYESEKRRRRVLDFDDLLGELAGAISSDADFAAAQRWRFSHLFVDELQDANASQLRLLDAWLGGRSDLFAVGDPRQAIYGWNGADPAAVLSFAERYPGAEVLALESNYRSTPQVVALASAALPARRRRPGTVDAPSGAFAAAVSAPRSTRPEGPVPTLKAYADAEAEAAAVATGIRLAHRPGRRWSQCAVLARTNAQLVLLEEALRGAGVPVRAAAGAAFLARPAVRTALAEVTGRDHAGLRSFLEGCADRAAALPEDSDDDANEDDEERAELSALVRLGEEYLELDPLASGDGFLSYLRGSLRGESSPGERDAVELATFHRAKGLEWSVVFVTGLEEGLVPIAHAGDAAALEEERRLLYVALSRAEEELHCSWARQRRFGSRVVDRGPSPYLDALEEERKRLERLAAPSTAGARQAIAASRALLEETESSPRLRG